MNSEEINQALIESNVATIQAMSAIAADTTRAVDERIKAAAAVSGMTETIVKGNLMGDAMRADDNTKKKMVKTLDKLVDKHTHDED